MAGSLGSIFNPKSTAIIGASRREEAVGHAVFKNMLESGYKGPLYPVNPKSDSILGVRCYTSITEIPDPVELAVLIVPAPAAIPTFQECIRKGVGGAILISAGFKEIGPEGARLEQELAHLSKKHGVPLIGPNCLGVINTDPAVSMNASFSRSMPQEGRIGFISQSGALCTAVLDYAKGTSIGFSKFISMGNKASVSELDLMKYLLEDAQTDVILMYLEDLAYPREMLELCEKIGWDKTGRKPILAIKSGRTVAGAKAASSHTGSLAGSDELYTSVFKQGGMLRVESVAELFDYARAFSTRKFPRHNRVAIVTNAGGPGIMTTDACIRHKLQVPTLNQETQTELKKHLPPTANISNPVDVIGDAQHGRYEAALQAVLKDSQVDACIVILTPQAMTDIEEIARVIGEVSKKSRKPVLASFMGIVDVSAGKDILRKWGVPHYRFPESAASTLAAMARYTAWLERPKTRVKQFRVNKSRAQSILKKAQREGRTNLTGPETTEILKAYGFPTLPMEFCATAEKAQDVAEAMGFPVVLKISSPDILHKIDVGGVKLGLKSRAEVRKGASELLATVKRKAPSAKIDGLVVQKMASPGREIILGLNRNPQFGPILMFGLGGTYVEIMKDVTFRVAPIRELAAHNMIRSIQGRPILQGIRGEKPADIPKLEECLQRLSQLAVDLPQIEELDINPMFAYNKGEGCMVVDSRILLEHPADSETAASPAKLKAKRR